ncbi:MAG: ATP-binding protein [Eubacterium sp.]|nr:ATP-binding protein [Eubacterium sp.]
MKITKIVITGGPCAGKTTGLAEIKKKFTELGYCVLIVPETATELISGGVAPWTCASPFEYQRFQMRLQMTKEEIFYQAACQMPHEKILILYDRGMMDNKAYLPDEEFAVLAEDYSSEEELTNRYDAVFHLLTAAKGAVEFYTLANNAARIETVEEAIQVDDRLLAAWKDHPHLRVIGNDYGFDRKIRDLLNEMADFLGEEIHW